MQFEKLVLNLICLEPEFLQMLDVAVASKPHLMA